MDFSEPVIYALKYSGVLPLFAKAFGGNGSILTFHRICPDHAAASFSPNSGLAITPEFFMTVIRFVRSRDYDIVTLDEAIERLSMSPKARRFVCLTFDDGYRDNFEFALPICRAEGIPFTVFVTTGFHDGRYAAWWLGLETLLATRSELRFEWSGVSYAFALSTSAEKNAAFTALAKCFSSLSRDDRNALEKVICAGTQVDFRALTSRLSMQPEMIAELDHSGVAIVGAHTVSHPRLAGLTEDEVRWEMQTGRDELEAIVGHKVRHFAYPFGRPCDAGPREFHICRELGFSTAVTTRNANLVAAHRGFTSRLPRLDISGKRQSLSAVEVQISGAPSALLHNFRRVVV